MNIQEAYTILEVSSDITDDDLKKKYKELAKKYHPDLYKENPDKFKLINEAHQLITDYRINPEKYEPRVPQGGGFWGNVANMGDIFFGSNFFNNDEDTRISQQHIKLNMKISFHESILGCSKEIKYNRSLKCSGCQGIGYKKIGNGCDKCDGFGRMTTNSKGVIFQSMCNKCQGKGAKKNPCDKCNGKKTLSEQRSGNINIPAGSKHAETLRLAGEGNFAGRNVFGDLYTDVFVELNIEKYKNMSLKDKDVHSIFTLSLLEALEGTTKEVETIYGNKEITINPKSKHTDQIKIAKCGVKGSAGSHIIELNVEYPDDVNNVIGALKNVIPDKL